MAKKDKPIEELMETKPGRYFLERKKGKNKKESALSAGYADAAHVSQIEKSTTYREIVRAYKDEMLDVISLGEIAQEHAKIIRQDRDLGAKNTAIKNAYERIDPLDSDKPDESDRLVVILR